MTAATTDPLAPLLDLPGVAEGAESIRRHVEAVHAHRTNRRGWPTTAAEASVRAARASAALDGGSSEFPEDGPVTDPAMTGSLRVAEALGGFLPTWNRAPLQVLARLHVLAATDRAPESELGRPRVGPGIAARLDALAGLVAGGTSVPAPVLVAVVHAELLGLAPFEVGNGIVARAAARLTAISTGLDPKGLVVPEVGHLRASAEYVAAAEAFSSGTREGLTRWFEHSLTAWRTGAKEATGIADAVG